MPLTLAKPPTSFASAAVGHFIAHANGEAWLSLITVESKAVDPAAACLQAGDEIAKILRHVVRRIRKRWPKVDPPRGATIEHNPLI